MKRCSRQNILLMLVRNRHEKVRWEFQWPNPRWVNNGLGVEARVDSDEAQQWERHYTSYQSVAIVVRQLPPSDVWEEFQDRVIDFCEFGYDKEETGSFDPTPSVGVASPRREWYTFAHE